MVLKVFAAGLVFALAPLFVSEVRADATLPSGCADRMKGQRLTLVVPNAAGGGFDIYARSLAPELERIGGVTVRVSNMPGGGGKAALLRVANAPSDDYAVLIDNAGDIVAELLEDPSLGKTPQDFRALGIVQVEPEAWVGRPDLNLMDPDAGPLVAAVSSVEANLGTVGLPAMATGHTVRLVAGYAGSGDQFAAVLRGETDFTSKAKGTALRAMKSGDLKVLLVLSDGPDPMLPDVPWLAGEGGLVAHLTAGLPEAERAERQKIAQLAVSLSSGARILMNSAAVPDDVQVCLNAIFDAALVSPDFRDAAQAQGRDVTPIGAQEAERIFENKLEAYSRAAPLLDEVATQLRP
ncbi:tripartite-type tricarboxylate transporter receptor subunit TctC [Rhodovulum marinum]|uniref:Tripartite-type tricarboxylate transporter receptor subunit TctC n=2 Tax=Rhodovulum marinum TaxID=320662 RepID=A0A4R2PXG7_9RHOB|nr:tripartite-type tricarboxylate transporter receptor subunit TctC [Rhodovulum marinum]